MALVSDMPPVPKVGAVSGGGPALAPVFRTLAAPKLVPAPAAPMPEPPPALPSPAPNPLAALVLPPPMPLPPSSIEKLAVDTHELGLSAPPRQKEK